MTASDSLFTAACGFSGSSYPRSRSKGCCHGNQFWD